VAEHTPVLLEEALAGLNLRSEGRYIDCTFGRGGHAGAILERLGPSGRVLAIDRDPQAIAAGHDRYAREPRLTLVWGSFGQLGALARQADMGQGVQGVLLDLGVSSPQLDDAARGFSFSEDGPLDMRMDPTTGPSAAEWLAQASEREIERVLREYGEERYARRIARAIVTARRAAPITRTLELAGLVARTVPTRQPGRHPATRTFQAIRIAVNGELDELRRALADSVELLAPAGRLAVISFHSLEDGIVKRFIERESKDDPMYAGLPDVPAHARARLLRIGRAVHPEPRETAVNPRARSAVLRVAERRVA
jgi:16S rRNA (cytosine1402-N4)-methyltransferase